MSHLARRLELLKIPSVRRVVLSCLLANIGAGMILLAMSWTVVGQQASVSALAWLMTCYWIPSLIFAPAIGAWVDRYDRRYVVMITKAVRIVVLLVAAAIYARYPGVPALLVLGFCMGTCAALYTPALLAMVRDLVPAKHLLDANAAVDVAFEIGFIIGMPVSGALLMLAPLPVVLVVTAGLFGLALMCLIGVRLGDDAGISPTRDVTRHAAFVQGLRYLLSHRRLLLMYSVQALMYVTLMTTSILLAPFAKVVLNLSAGEFGAIEAALSLGVVVGASILPASAQRWGYGPALVMATLAMTICFALFAMAESFVSALLLYFLIGGGLATWPVVTTAAQELTDPAMQGRVQAAGNAASSVLILATYLLLGAAAPYISIRWSYVSVMAFSATACLMACWIYFVSPDRAERPDP